MKIELVQSQTSFTQRGLVSINGKPQVNLTWAGCGHTALVLYPEGEQAIKFTTDAGFRSWIKDWHKRQKAR